MIDKREFGHAFSFNELEVYGISENISRRIFGLSNEFPKEERYALTDQIRRASRLAELLICPPITDNR